MAVITFVNNSYEETGKTMSLVAIATHMAIEHNNKILIISTTNKEDKIKSCYFEDKQEKKLRLGILGDNKDTIDTESGIDGIAKIARSNKLTPQMITNYTKVIFKDRLEVILGAEKKEITDDQELEEKEVQEEYIDLINVANMQYDLVFVDLDLNINEKIRQKIIQSSDIVILNTNQNQRNIKKIKENSELLQSNKTLILIGRYDKFTKCNAKNVTRYLERREQVLTIPYNTIFMEATNEAGVPDLFLSFRKLTDPEDRNTIFMGEVKRVAQSIIYKLQELQAHR